MLEPAFLASLFDCQWCSQWAFFLFSRDSFPGAYPRRVRPEGDWCLPGYLLFSCSHAGGTCQWEDLLRQHLTEKRLLLSPPYTLTVKLAPIMPALCSHHWEAGEVTSIWLTCPMFSHCTSHVTTEATLTKHQGVTWQSRVRVREIGVLLRCMLIHVLFIWTLANAIVTSAQTQGLETGLGVFPSLLYHVSPRPLLTHE